MESVLDASGQAGVSPMGYSSASPWTSSAPGTPNDTSLASDSPRQYHNHSKPEAHVPRPPNGYLLFRSDFLKRKVIPSHAECKQQNISRVAGACWKSLSPDEQKVWNDLAREKQAEHVRMYPDYKYQPKKRGPVKKRRKMMTREQEIEHCARLQAIYVPEIGGSVVTNTESTPQRKNKSRAKHRVDGAVEVPPAADVPPFSSTPGGAASLERPVLPPPHSKWKGPTLQSSKQLSLRWTTHAAVGPDLQPPPFYRFDGMIPPSEDGLQMKWGIQTFLSVPRLIADGYVPLSASFCKQEKIKSDRRRGVIPLSTDTVEAQAMSRPQSFPASPHSIRHSHTAHLMTPKAYNPGSANTGLSHGCALQQYQNSLTMSHPPPAYHPARIADTGRQVDTLPQRPTPSPQHFPMTLHTPTSVEPVQLHPTVFTSPIRAKCNFETLTIDEAKLDELPDSFGLDQGEFRLFGDVPDFGMCDGTGTESGWSSLQLRDILEVEICSRES